MVDSEGRRQGTCGWVKRHPVASFFLLAYAISWLASIPAALGYGFIFFLIKFGPALASLVAHLVLREGFSDVSFRLGGRRGWSAIVVAFLFPIVVGLIAYGIAWMTTLARFDPRFDIAGDAASPLTAFVIVLAASATIGTLNLTLTAAGEEIGWRGYMLTRPIDAGVPRPVLVSGLLWGLWHVPGTLTGVYSTGPSPLPAWQPERQVPLS